jgi:hypothetical protein
LPALESQAATGSNTPPAVTYLEKEGVTLTYLGGDGGVRGYLGKDPEGKFQAFYIMPDGVHFIAGLMFGQNAQDTTGAQIQQMKDRFNALTSGQTPAPASEPSVGSVPVGGASPAATATPAPTASDTITQPSLPVAMAPVNSAGSALTIPGAAPATTSGPITALTSAAFNTDISHAFPFTVGYPNATPVYMVADPQCEYCHAAWLKIKPLVESGQVLLYVVMINGLPGSEPYAMGLLAENNPGQAWYDGAGSTPAIGMIPPPPAAGSAEYTKVSGWLAANDSVAKSLGMTKTPFLAYIGASGTFHKIQAPDDVLAFLSDLRPTKPVMSAPPGAAKSQ